MSAPFSAIAFLPCGPPELPYEDFLRAKVAPTKLAGFEIDADQVNPSLKQHQNIGVRWCVRGGRRALFEAFGLGKTVQQIDIIRLILKHAGGRGLIVLRAWSTPPRGGAA